MIEDRQNRLWLTRIQYALSIHLDLTGTPKGVVLNHKSFFDFIAWAVDAFGFDGSEVMGGLSPVVFDIYNFELFMTMTQGSSMSDA